MNPGIQDRGIEHGSQKELYIECGIDDLALIAAVKEMLPAKGTKKVRARA